MASNKTNWVAISESLPETGVDVLLYHQSGEILKGFISNNGEWSVYYKGHPVAGQKGITDWMPVPETSNE